MQLNPREILFKILKKHFNKGVFIRELIVDETDKSINLMKSQKYLYHCGYGIIRQKKLLNYLISHISGRRQENVENNLMIILRIGFYELLFLENSPDYAVINEWVSITKRIVSNKAGGFVNAILRKLQRMVSFQDFDIQDKPYLRLSRDRVYYNGIVFRFSEEIFPSYKTDEIKNIAVRFSHPEWLIRRWSKAFGLEKAIEICYANNIPPVLTIWPNKKYIDSITLEHRLNKKGIKTRKGDLDSIDIEEMRDLIRSDLFSEGLFYFQGRNEALISKEVNASQGDVILDLFSAPGGKTISIASNMPDKVTIYSVDNSIKRLQRVKENINRLRLDSIHIICADCNHLPFKIRFNKVVMDVPCSNTGVLGRRVEARWRLNPGDIDDLAVYQEKLLMNILPFVEKEGKLIYSTCSIENEENRIYIEKLNEIGYNSDIINKQILLPDTMGNSGSGYITLLIN